MTDTLDAQLAASYASYQRGEPARPWEQIQQEARTAGCRHEYRHLRQLSTFVAHASDGTYLHGGTREQFYCIRCLDTQVRDVYASASDVGLSE